MAQDVAVAHAFVTYKGLSAEGRELRAMHNRLTWALKQENGAWKIVHEHISAPADFKTSKDILQRWRSRPHPQNAVRLALPGADRALANDLIYHGGNVGSGAKRLPLANPHSV